MQNSANSIKGLKECPFCGRIWMTVETMPGDRFTVRCGCGASGPMEMTRKRAIRGWNTRDQHLFWNPFRLSVRFPNNSLSVDFRGKLESLDLATLLQMLYNREKTGILQITRDHIKAAICMKDGNIIAASDSNGMRIGEILFNNKLISKKNLRKALEMAEQSDKMLGEALLLLQFIDEKILRNVIQQQVEEAVLDLMGWKQGTFEYRDCMVEFDPRVMNQIKPLEVVMKFVRREDEDATLLKEDIIPPVHLEELDLAALESLD